MIYVLYLFNKTNKDMEKQLSIVKAFYPEFDNNEALSLIEDYQKDNSTTVCPCCREELHRDDVVSGISYTRDSIDSEWSICPHCGAEDIEVEKPELEEWLYITE